MEPAAEEAAAPQNHAVNDAPELDADWQVGISFLQFNVPIAFHWFAPPFLQTCLHETFSCSLDHGPLIMLLKQASDGESQELVDKMVHLLQGLHPQLAPRVVKGLRPHKLLTERIFKSCLLSKSFVLSATYLSLTGVEMLTLCASQPSPLGQKCTSFGCLQHFV